MIEVIVAHRHLTISLLFKEKPTWGELREAVEKEVYYDESFWNFFNAELKGLGDHEDVRSFVTQLHIKVRKVY